VREGHRGHGQWLKGPNNRRSQAYVRLCSGVDKTTLEPAFGGRRRTFRINHSLGISTPVRFRCSKVGLAQIGRHLSFFSKERNDPMGSPDGPVSRTGGVIQRIWVRTVSRCWHSWTKGGVRKLATSPAPGTVIARSFALQSSAHGEGSSSSVISSGSTTAGCGNG